MANKIAFFRIKKQSVIWFLLAEVCKPFEINLSIGTAHKIIAYDDLSIKFEQLTETSVKRLLSSGHREACAQIGNICDSAGRLC